LTALLEERLVRRVREQGIGATGGSTVFTGQPLLVTGAIFPFFKKKIKIKLTRTAQTAFLQVAARCSPDSRYLYPAPSFHFEKN
jgi:hypothetical protein